MKLWHVVVGITILAGGGVTASAVPISSTPLNCFASQDTALYDTPSGFLDAGFYIKGSGPTATSTTLATQIGTQYIEYCTDGVSKYLCGMTQKEYSDNFDGTAARPAKSANVYAIGGTKCE